METSLLPPRIGWPQRALDLTTEGDTRDSWDGDRILQVVTNLMTSAIKYSPDDSRVTLSVRGDGARVEPRFLRSAATGHP